jgi:predicted transglutaminase-like cysteine proteinase
MPPDETGKRAPALEPVQGVTMLARLAACAVFVLFWPSGNALADEDGPLALPEIVVEAAGPSQTTNTKRIESDTSPQRIDVAIAHAAERLQAQPPTGSAQPPVGSESAPAFEPFGLVAERVVAGGISVKWSGVETQIKAENQVFAHCRDGSWCPRAARRFLAVIDHGIARRGRARIGLINREINLSIVPTSDLVQWGVADRWGAPLETFTTRHGDCEDYAIAKYVALRAAGVPKTDVRLVVVRNNAIGQYHAVVAVRLDGGWIILDNRWLALVRDREMWRATPLFELDDSGVRRFIGPLTAGKLAQASAGAS